MVENALKQKIGDALVVPLSLDDGPAVLAAAMRAFAAGVTAAQAENDRLGIVAYGRDPVTGAIVARQPQVPLQFEEFIVRGVSAGGNALGDHDELSGRQDFPENFDGFRRNQSDKAWSCQYLEKLLFRSE
jgi:hypothetical protein